MHFVAIKILLSKGGDPWSKEQLENKASSAGYELSLIHCVRALLPLLNTWCAWVFIHGLGTQLVWDWRRISLPNCKSLPIRFVKWSLFAKAFSTVCHVLCISTYLFLCTVTCMYVCAHLCMYVVHFIASCCVSVCLYLYTFYAPNIQQRLCGPQDFSPLHSACQARHRPVSPGREARWPPTSIGRCQSPTVQRSSFGGGEAMYALMVCTVWCLACTLLLQ